MYRFVGKGFKMTELEYLKLKKQFLDEYIQKLEMLEMSYTQQQTKKQKPVITLKDAVISVLVDRGMQQPNKT